MISKRASGGGGLDEGAELVEMDFLTFHENVEIVRLNSIDQVQKVYMEDVKSYLTCSFGVLLFLYSVMLTRVSKLSINFSV